MASLTIVTGCPGTGKTTICRRIAAVDPRGLHLLADPFYEFPAHPIDPTTPASHAQNTAIVRAVARAAGAFVEADYSVWLDGIFGPWFLPVVAEELVAFGAPARYVVLQAGIEETLRRATEREAPAPAAVVRQMHRAFGELEEFAGHALETEGRTADEVLRDLEERLARGEFALDLASLA